MYALPALALISIFPRPDGSMSDVKAAAMGAYALGFFVWLAIGFLGVVRIGSFKDKPKMQRMAFMRLAILEVPMMLVSIAVILMINRAPSLSLDMIEPTSASQLIAPVSITFGTASAAKIFASEKLTPLEYEWDSNGDGLVDQKTFDPQATFVFQKAGIYQIQTRVTMTNGETRKISARLVIPQSSFSVEPIRPIIDEPTSFTLENLLGKQTAAPDPAGPPALANAKWDFDSDGTIDFETEKLEATYTYHKLGPVNATVTAYFANQTQSTFKRTIEVVNPPKQPFPITMETDPTTLLGPTPFGVLFTLKTGEQIANATWSFGDQKNSEGLRVAHVYNEIGNFTVTALVRSQSGATAKLTKLVRVTNPLELRDLSFEGSPDVRNFAIEGEVPLTIDLTPNTSQPLISFSWEAPNASDVTLTDKTLHAIYRQEGKYSIDLIGTDPDQNVLRKHITVTVKQAASTVDFTMDPPSPTAPASVKFDASDTYVSPDENITGFEWDFGDNAGPVNGGGVKFSGSRIDHVFQKPGTYTITLTVRTTAGKFYDDKKQLVVRAPLVDACFMPSRRSGKAPLGVRFDTSCSTGDFTQWVWDFGDNAQSDEQNPTHVFTEPGEYHVILTATDTSGSKRVKDTTISVSAE